MKKQKFELSHDIIAEKIWARLPEQDKQLRMIQASIRQRQEDYAAGKGSLLGKAELEGWEVFLSKMELSELEQRFWDDSFQKLNADEAAEAQRLEKEKKQVLRNRQLQRRIGFVLGAMILISVLFIWRAFGMTRDANHAISKQKVAEAAFAFQNQHTQKAFRLVQKALEHHPENDSAKNLQQFYLDYLGIIQRKEVIEFKISPDYKHIALLIQQNDSVIAEVFALDGASKYPKVFSSKKLAKSYSYSYRDSYRFSGRGRHIALLIQQNDSVIAEVFALNGAQKSQKVFSSKKLAKSDSDSYRYSFSKEGRYIAMLTQKGKKTILSTYSLCESLVEWLHTGCMPVI